MSDELVPIKPKPEVVEGEYLEPDEEVINPGNHVYYSPGSPWMYNEEEHVHVYGRSSFSDLIGKPIRVKVKNTHFDVRYEQDTEVKQESD